MRDYGRTKLIAVLARVPVQKVTAIVRKLHLLTALERLLGTLAFSKPIKIAQISLAVEARDVSREPLRFVNFQYIQQKPASVPLQMLSASDRIIVGVEISAFYLEGR